MIGCAILLLCSVEGYASQRAESSVGGHASQHTEDATPGSVAYHIPRLVVSVTVDQLRSDYLEAFEPFYGEGGLRRLLSQGVVYTSASYPFSPVDRASAVAALTTGVPPSYNSIVGQRWLNRETLRPVQCTDDEQFHGIQTSQTASPAMLSTSTTGDELKIATAGKGQVWSIAPYCDAAVMAGGHAADGVLWIDDETGEWCSSQYYGSSLPSWVRSMGWNNVPANKAAGKDEQRFKHYKATHGVNADITAMAIRCLDYTGLGRDDMPDLLCLTYNAGGDNLINSRDYLREVYRALDTEIVRLLNNIGQRIGLEHVLVVLTGTGYCEEHEETDYAAYRIPTGTFYMSRTADLLNMYLGAIWGQGKYVDTTFRNHIFLNHALLDKKTISIGEATRRAQELLVMMSGVRNVYTSLQLLTLGNDQIERVRNGYSPERCGDLVIEAAPGWRVLTENTGESEYARASFVQFPIIFFSSGLAPQRIQTPVTTDRIAPTIARAIRTRAPNACSAEPLF